MQDSTYVYVSQDVAKSISVYRLSGSTGHLTPIQDIGVDGKAMPMAVSPDRRFLYISLRNDPYSFASLAIDSRDGTLSLLGKSAAADSTVYNIVDRSGRFLLGACNPANAARKSGLLTINPIGPQGIVQSPGIKIRTPPKLHSVIPDPTNRFLFAASCDGDLILRFSFDATLGTANSDGLTPVALLPKSGPRHLRFHPNGNFFYVINEYDGSVVSYRYAAATGSLYELQTINAVPDGYTGNNPRAAEIQLSPNGRWLYASVRETDTIAAFAVDPITGGLSLTGHFATAKEPRGFAIDPTGRYLVAGGALTKTMVSFRIDDQSGALERIGEFPVGEGANWVEIVRLP